MRPRMRVVITNLAVLILGITLIVSVTELILRTTHLFNARVSWTEPDETIAWRFTPLRDYWFAGENDHPITGKINSMGWRDVEHSVEKQAGTTRVAVIGDSYVEAFQVELDSTFTRIAERTLRASGREIDVMAFGRAGMTQTEELLVLRNDVLVCDPDVVVVVFVPQNDILDIARETATNSLRPFYSISDQNELTLDTSFNQTVGFVTRTRINFFKQRSALISLMAERYNVLRRQRANEIATAPIAPGGRLSGYLSLATANPSPRFAQNYLLNKRLIREMAETCAQKKIRFILAGINVVYTTDAIAACRAIDPSFDPDFFDHDLSALCQEMRAEYIGLQGIFREHHDRTGDLLHWAHWNYKGHRVVGDALVQSLLSE